MNAFPRQLLVALCASVACASGGALGADDGVRYYDLQSRDYSGLVGEMNKKGPKGFHGEANWKVTYTYSWDRSSDGSCLISMVTPTLEGEIVMPRWAPGPSVTAEQRRKWQQYVERLREHEDGHMENGEQAASAVSGLRGMRASCGSIDSAFKQRADGLIRSYAAKDVEYDRATEHGRKQGAVLPR